MAMEALFVIPRGGLEIGGVLFGSFAGDSVIIRAFRPVECEHATGPSFILSGTDEAGLSALLTSAAADGLAAVGWFRSRTRSGIQLSPADVTLFNTYFPDPQQVAFVLRPEVSGATHGGFFFRAPDGSLQMESSQGEFLVEPSAAVPNMVTPEPPAPIVKHPELRLTAADLAPRSYPRVGWLFALCIVLVVALVAAHEYLATPSPVEDRLSLEAYDRNGQIEFAWSRSARAIVRARGAKIEIRDGPSRYSAELDGAQIQRGSFHYVRQTERVDIHLTVRDSDGRKSEEYLCWVGPVPIAVE